MRVTVCRILVRKFLPADLCHAWMGSFRALRVFGVVGIVVGNRSLRTSPDCNQLISKHHLELRRCVRLWCAKCQMELAEDVYEGTDC